MLSTKTMLERVQGMQGKDDLTPWEDNFIGSIVEYADKYGITRLSGKQVITLKKIHDKHFADS